MKLMLVFAAALIAVVTSDANAASLTLTRKTVDNGWEKVRMNCDQFGRCWKEGNRNPLRDSYNFAPPPRPAPHSPRR